jgi:DNA-directed RNA polymerase subunit M/transcription elongation factor TFIIS
MIFSAFTPKQKHEIRAALSHAKRKGITDVEEVLRRLEQEANEDRRVYKKMDYEQREAARKKKREYENMAVMSVPPMPELLRTCPDCGRESLIMSIPENRQLDYGFDKYIFRCACGFSRLFTDLKDIPDGDL